MPAQHSKLTIVSMAVIASATATLLHEGVGHGVTAWLRGAGATELTSNHLSTLRPDRWVDAGGTLVNLFVGALCLLLSRRMGERANPRYFLWLLGALNLLPGAGYFIFSGVGAIGDWYDIIRGLPHELAIRIAMTIVGCALYVLVVRLLAVNLSPFISERRTYNTVGRLPYLAACLFSCAAGALDPLGIKLLFLSTIPAAFGGSSGLLWADNLLPRPLPQHPLTVHRAPTWWIAALILGLAYILILGRGVHFAG